jgi:hypothetical protein
VSASLLKEMRLRKSYPKLFFKFCLHSRKDTSSYRFLSMQLAYKI